MAKIDYLKEKADKMKIIFRFILNTLFALSVGIAGLIYGLVTKAITTEMFWFLISPLLFFIVKGVIIALLVWKKSSDIDEKILKEI